MTLRVVLLSTVLLLGLAPLALAEAFWTKEEIDNSIYPYAGDPSIAIDTNGVVHVSYLYIDPMWGYWHKYARKEAGVWTGELVNLDYEASYSSIKVDALGRPHIAYHSQYLDDLMYAVKQGTWTWESVDGGGRDADGVGTYSSLALDANGDPHIAYFDWVREDLKYARKSGGVWAIEIVDSTDGLNTYCSIAVDSQGRPWIAYRGLRFAVKDGGAWNLTTIDPPDGRYCSLSLDSNEQAHMSYIETGLQYARGSAGDWVIEQIDPGDGHVVGHHSSMVVDGADTPIVAYLDATTDDLKFAWRSGIWRRELVEEPNAVVSVVQCAIDGNNIPHIIYFDSTTSQLMMATRSAPTDVRPAGGAEIRLLVTPNPAVGGVATFSFPPTRHEARLAVYDTAGRRVRDFALGNEPIQWDGRDHLGRQAAAGVYYLRLTSSTGTAARSFTVLR